MRINGMVPEQQVSQNGMPDILSRVNVGDVIKAKVLSITSDELLLQLFDGTTMTATSMSQLNAKPGDLVDFTVKNKNEKQVFLETVKNDVQKSIEKDAGYEKLLKSLEIKPTQNNIETAKLMEKQGMQISKENFQKVADMCSGTKQLKPSEAVFCVSNNITPTSENISSIKQLVGGGFKLANEVDKLIKLLDALTGSNVSQAPETKNNPVQQVKEGAVVQNLNNTNSKQHENTNTNEEILVTSQQNESRIITLNNKIDNRPETKVHNQSINTQGTIVRASLDNSVPKNLDPKTSDIKNPIIIPDKTNNITLENTDSLNTAQQVKKDSISISDASFSATTAITEKTDISTSKSVLNAGNDLVGAIEKSLNEIKFEKFVMDNSKQTANMDEVKKSMADIKEALRELFVRVDEHNINPGDLDPKVVHKELENKLAEVRESIDNLQIPNKAEIVSKIDNLENSLKLINDINNYNTYFQIPLNIRDWNTTGEIYILKRDSKRKKIDPDNVTMYISLNTENLGQVESLINVTNKKIAINMRVENNEIIDHIKDAYMELYERLEEKGYKLVDIKYRLIDEKTDLLNFKDIIKHELERNRVTIDYRL